MPITEEKPRLNIEGLFFREQIVDLAKKLATLDPTNMEDADRLNELAHSMGHTITVAHCPPPQEPEQVEVYIGVTDQREVRIAQDFDELVTEWDLSPVVNYTMIKVLMPVPETPQASATVEIKTEQVKPLSIEIKGA